ncbi:MAG: hypothetical protein HC905_04565 [Bacteroidales bacterium]|nr:hypothetical protein [Bacteroidales bacterium]
MEDIEPENFKLQGYGLVANGTTFTKQFAKGDVLFGKRRAYLKKVAVADFDGICSRDILVVRAKNKKMLQELLPFYLSSDAFIQHAISTSAGSLSPRTKWKDLAEIGSLYTGYQNPGKNIGSLTTVRNHHIPAQTAKSHLKAFKAEAVE